MDRWIDDRANADAYRSQRSDSASSILETLLRRDRVIILGALVLITSLAWAYLLSGAGMDMDTQGMDMNMVMPMEWTPLYALVMFLMWWIMMTAMMLPGAAPLILLFALVNRRSRERGDPYVPAAVFASGYLLVWGAFSLVATLLQWSMQKAGWLTMGMASAHTWLGGALLLAAGIYQFTPLKHACLRHCRGPIDFIARHWRPGSTGALRMGLTHGAYCAGCCWLVMGLLFYGGVMNLYWIVGLALLVLIEKLLPAGHALGRFSGAGFIACGVWLLVVA